MFKVGGINYSRTRFTGPDLPEPRFTGRIIFPRSRNLTVYHPGIPGTPIYRAKPFPPSIPVNRGPTVFQNSEINNFDFQINLGYEVTPNIAYRGDNTAYRKMAIFKTFS
eukprot:sb/3477407/